MNALNRLFINALKTHSSFELFSGEPIMSGAHNCDENGLDSRYAPVCEAVILRSKKSGAEEPALQPDSDDFGTTDCCPLTEGEHAGGLRHPTTSI